MEDWQRAHFRRWLIADGLMSEREAEEVVSIAARLMESPAVADIAEHRSMTLEEAGEAVRKARGEHLARSMRDGLGPG